MIYHAINIDEAIHALKAFKKCGVVYVGCEHKNKSGPNFIDMIQFECVFTDEDGNIVGMECKNYKPNEGEIKVVRIS